MDTAAQWPQQDMVKPMEDMMLPLPNPSSSRNNKVVTKPHKERGCFSCPRCNSNNTKFCYYNNYSLSQPRFFCKTCRRYWTQGGSLRNIPVGGASRKNVNKITSSPSSNNNNSKKQQNPSTTRDQLHLMKSFMPTFQTPNSLDLLTSSSRVLYNNYALMPLVGHSSLPELNKSPNSSSLNFSLDGLGGNYGHFLGAQQNNNNNNNNNNNSDDKILFPFEDLKLQDSHTDRDNQNGDPGNGFWNGVVGGGSW